MAGSTLRTSGRLLSTPTSMQSPPLFLMPSFVCTAPYTPTAQFSSSESRCRRTKDNNKARGVSGLRRTGLKYPLSMSKEPLPQPVLDPAKRSKVNVDPNHGLWGFFNKRRTALTKPEDEAAHGNLMKAVLGTRLTYFLHRTTVGRGRATTHVIRGSALLVVDLLQGAQSDRDGKS